MAVVYVAIYPMVQVTLGTLMNHDKQNDHSIQSQHSQSSHLSGERKEKALE